MHMSTMSKCESFQLTLTVQVCRYYAHCVQKICITLESWPTCFLLWETPVLVCVHKIRPQSRIISITLCALFKGGISFEESAAFLIQGLNTYRHVASARETGYSRFLVQKAARMMANATCWIWIPAYISSRPNSCSVQERMLILLSSTRGPWR